MISPKLHVSTPSLSFWDCKNTTFFLSRKLFRKLFYKKFLKYLCVRKKKFSFFQNFYKKNRDFLSIHASFHTFFNRKTHLSPVWKTKFRHNALKHRRLHKTKNIFRNLTTTYSLLITKILCKISYNYLLTHHKKIFLYDKQNIAFNNKECAILNTKF